VSSAFKDESRTRQVSALRSFFSIVVKFRACVACCGHVVRRRVEQTHCPPRRRVRSGFRQSAS
jgi:hypothetical protein